MTEPTTPDPVPTTPDPVPAADAPAPPLTPAATSSTVAPAADAVAPEDASQTTEQRRPRRLAFTARMLAVARWLFALALFIAGIALGNLIFQATQAPPVAVAVDGSVQGDPPAVVREFIGALGAGDAAAMRSSMAAEPYARLIAEMRKLNVAEISSVETLSTSVDGTRTATAVVLKAVTTANVPIAMNLVILNDGGTIEGFR